MKSGAALACLMAPFADPAALKAAAARGLTVLALEFVPRITRAQSMDVLSSQANLAGYRAVIDAAAQYGKIFPMLMTAAGTISPCKLFVLGAGVAGLQAIATARRLGAIVSATDVRRAAGEQIASLGAKFVFVELQDDMETAAGYAKELSEDDKRRQAALVAEHVKSQDIVIATALVPGRPAPRLISAAMVASMKPGSVVVDLAVESGGNCGLAKLDQVITTDNGVTIVGYGNLPSRVAVDASALFARNLFNLLSPFIDKTTKALALDFDDEVIKGTLAARGASIVHPALAALAAPALATETAA